MSLLQQLVAEQRQAEGLAEISPSRTGGSVLPGPPPPPGPFPDRSQSLLGAFLQAEALRAQERQAMLVAVRESSAAAARGALQELLPLVQAAVDASVRAADTPRGVDSASLAAALEATLPAALSSPVADSLAPALEASLRASLLPPMEQATCGRRLGRISAASPSLPRPRLGPVSAPCAAEPLPFGGA